MKAIRARFFKEKDSGEQSTTQKDAEGKKLAVKLGTKKKDAKVHDTVDKKGAEAAKKELRRSDSVKGDSKRRSSSDNRKEKPETSASRPARHSSLLKLPPSPRGIMGGKFVCSPSFLTSVILSACLGMGTCPHIFVLGRPFQFSATKWRETIHALLIHARLYLLLSFCVLLAVPVFALLPVDD
jgi:hypothetical protein